MFAHNNNSSYICKGRIDRSSYRLTKVIHQPFLPFNLMEQHKYDGIMEEEIWKDIPSWEGLYQVSDKGNIQSMNYYHKKGRIHPRKKCIGSGNYLYVILDNKDRSKRYSVHRLVAMAFIPNPENKPCIDHINGDRQDNRVENLRWCTHKENNNNPLTIAKYKAIPRKPYTDEWRRKISEAGKGKGCIAILQFTKAGVFLKEWPSAREATLFLGKSKKDSSITACCRGRQASALGYKWKYKKD